MNGTTPSFNINAFTAISEIQRRLGSNWEIVPLNLGGADNAGHTVLTLQKTGGDACHIDSITLEINGTKVLFARAASLEEENPDLVVLVPVNEQTKRLIENPIPINSREPS